MGGHLREQIFQGMQKGIRDSLYFCMVSYTQLVIVTKKNESKMSEAKMIQSKAAAIETVEAKNGLTALTSGLPDGYS